MSLYQSYPLAQDRIVNFHLDYLQDKHVGQVAQARLALVLTVVYVARVKAVREVRIQRQSQFFELNKTNIN